MTDEIRQNKGGNYSLWFHARDGEICFRRQISMREGEMIIKKQQELRRLIEEI